MYGPTLTRMNSWFSVDRYDAIAFGTVVLLVLIFLNYINSRYGR